MYIDARFVRHERVTERSFTLEQEQIVDTGVGYQYVTTRSEPKLRSAPMLSREKKLYRSNIIAKPGRIPYDSNIQKIAFKNHVETPAGYKSVQSQINIGPGGTVDPVKLKKYLDSTNFTKVDHRNVNGILAIAPGLRVAYINTDNKWRSGGFFIEAKKGNQTGEEKFHYQYILYKGFNHAVYSLQLGDIHDLFIKFPIKKRPGVVVYKDITHETNYPVYINNNIGERVILSYQPSGWAQKRAYVCPKYKKAQTNGWMFMNGTQVPSKFNFELVDNDDEEYNDDSDSDSDSDDSSE
jgi:hypothetical protein